MTKHPTATPDEISTIVARFQRGDEMKCIATDLNISVDRVRYQLKKAGAYIPRKVGKHNLPVEEILEQYKNDVPFDDLAKKYNVNKDVLIKLVDRAGIRKPNWLKTVPWKVGQEIADPVKFAEVHINYPSLRDKAEYFNCGVDLMKSAHRQHGIEVHAPSMSRSLSNRKHAQLDFSEESYRAAYASGMPLVEMADQMGISVNYLRQTIVDHNWNEGLVFDSTLHRTRPELWSVLTDKNTLEQLTKLYTQAQMSDMLGCTVSTLSKYTQHHGIQYPDRHRSAAENEIADLIRSWGIEVKQSDKKMIYPLELDILVESHNLAIEYCGLYWHSEEQNRGANYHTTKLNLCTEKDIRLITIFEDEYKNNKDIVISKLRRILKQPAQRKVNARSCTVKEITASTKNRFLNNNHLQGEDRATIKLGLFDGPELVAVMTFSHPSIAKRSGSVESQHTTWELNRYATERNTLVRGGLGKLLSHFKRNYPWTEVFTYADLRWSRGDVYSHSGFELTSRSNPNYWYYNIKDSRIERFHRYNFRKDRLVAEGFDSTKSEREIMKERGYTRIWDCGMLKFSVKNPNYSPLNNHRIRVN